MVFDILRQDVVDAFGNAPGCFFVRQILAGMIALRLGFCHLIVSQDEESLRIRFFNGLDGIQDPKGGMLFINGLVFLIKPVTNLVVCDAFTSMIAARRFSPTATTSAPFMLPNVTVAKMPRLSNSAQMRYSPAKLRWYLLIFMRLNKN